LTEEQCCVVLEQVETYHDASIGISLDVLDDYADEEFPMTRETHNAVKNFKDLQNVALIDIPFEEIDAAWKEFVTSKDLAKR
jgi:hypothetical protein